MPKLGKWEKLPKLGKWGKYPEIPKNAKNEENGENAKNGENWGFYPNTQKWDFGDCGDEHTPQAQYDNYFQNNPWIPILHTSIEGIYFTPFISH